MYLPQATQTAETGEAPPHSPPPPSPSSTNWRDRPTASPADRAYAEELFREGRELAQKGNTLEACAKFEESMNADPALGTLMNWADCRERVGQHDIACVLFQQALDWAHDTASNEREQFLANRLAELHC